MSSTPNVFEKIHRRRRLKARVRLAIAFIFVLVFFAGAVFLALADALRIQEVRVSGVENIQKKEKIHSFVEERLEGFYGHLFPKDNAFLYPADEMREDTLKKFPFVENVHFATAQRSLLNVFVAERSSDFLWCVEQGPNALGGAPQEKTVPEKQEQKSPCFSLDEDGVIFERVGTAATSSGVVVVSREDAAKPRLGEQVIAPETLASLASFERFLTPVTRVNGMIIHGNGRDYTFVLTGDTRIIVDGEDSTRSSLDTLSSFMQSGIANKETATSSKNFFDNFKYIDIRFGNKVFYKLKD